MTDQQNTGPGTGQEHPKKRKFNYLPLAGAILGAIGGYIYYLEVGCKSGSCAITSSPYLSMLWGTAIGYLLFDLIRKKPARQRKTGQ
jgi:cobalamin synthase